MFRKVPVRAGVGNLYTKKWRPKVHKVVDGSFAIPKIYEPKGPRSSEL